MKKKIIIFTCTGGHTSAAQAVQEYLSDEYDIVVLNIFTQVLNSLDVIRMATFGVYNSEDLYNFFLKNHWYKFINKWLLPSHRYYSWQKKRVSRHIRRVILDCKPDMIISVIPLFNHHIFAVAKELHIPFLLIPTDIDVRTFLIELKGSDYPLFRVGLMVDNSISRSMLLAAGIQGESIDQVGPVLRNDFFLPKDRARIRRNFGIFPAKRVILLTMGSQGSASLPRFCQAIVQVAIPVHLIVVLGKNKTLRGQIEQICFPSHISVTILDFTSQMAELMAVADLLITKSGGMSVMEGIGMNLPMLLDATSEVIIWEQSNQALILQHGLGLIISNVNCLKRIIEITLQDDELDKYRSKYAELLLRIAPHELKRVVKKMLD